MMKPAPAKVAARYLGAQITFKWIDDIHFLQALDQDGNQRGYLRVKPEAPVPEFLRDTKCPEELTELFERFGPAPVWKGWMTEIDYNLRRQGIGVGMYEALISKLRRKHPGGFYFIPSKCGRKGEGSTTHAADRVWDSLSGKYPSSGLCLYIP